MLQFMACQANNLNSNQRYDKLTFLFPITLKKKTYFLLKTETNAVARCTTIVGQARHLAVGDFEGQIQTW